MAMARHSCQISEVRTEDRQNGLKILIAVFILLALSTDFIYGIQLEKVGSWKHEERYQGPISGAFFDSQGNLILTFRKHPVAVNKEKTIPFATYGQGPDEATRVYTICDYRGNIALFEDIDKIKVFQAQDEKYVSKQTIWLKRDPFPFFLKTALFYQNYFFLAGLKIMNVPASADKMDIANMQIFDDCPETPGKNILLENGVKMDRQYEIERFLIPYNDYVLYLKQSEPKIYFISLKTLEVEKSVKLAVPEIYKPMPKDFYMRKDYRGDHTAYLIDLETWATSYSAITRAILYRNSYLLLQIRTCAEKPARFVLLFYNLKNDCSLEKVIYLNDLLLAEKDGLLYCYKDGNPDLDENAEDFEIIIYKLQDQ
jgi:hypothetical protein